MMTQWTYSRKEWNAFLRLKKNKSRSLTYLIHFLFSGFYRKTPVVNISPEMISIGNQRRNFNDDRYPLKRVDLNNVGGVNILAITFGKNESGRDKSEIRVPVPKGKLREAIEVQARLSKTRSN